MILFVTSGITHDRRQNAPLAAGGSDQVFDPWRPTPESLRPLTYECSLRNDQRRSRRMSVAFGDKKYRATRLG
jgi:hypothetical protein